jgi:hypothetical protein
VFYSNHYSKDKGEKMTGANSGSAGVSEPRPTTKSRKGVKTMAGVNTGSAGVGKPRQPKKAQKK